MVTHINIQYLKLILQCTGNDAQIFKTAEQAVDQHHQRTLTVKLIIQYHNRYSFTLRSHSRLF